MKNYLSITLASLLHFLWLRNVLIAADSEFSFDEEIYAHVIKSTSKPFKPLFHIKAPHCKYGDVFYSIVGRNHPFEIFSQNGSIYLPRALDPSSPIRFDFSVRVRDPNGLCFATTQVQVYVVHVNEHKPIMSAAKYHCKVNENERSIEIKPGIRATDKDEGEAGKIRSIRIREQGVPFKIVMQSDGHAKLVATEELDAEIMSEYRFSIFAVDNGTRARKSERSRVYCDVIDVNEFAPIFKHPTYEAEIQKGRTYERIIQLEAIDQDISSKNGKVCNYAILENGMPFSMNSAGVLSLQEELPANYPDYVMFHVKATDCAKKDSEDDAVVKITVKERHIKTTPTTQLKRPDCKPAVHFKSESTLQYPSCTKHLPLLPSAVVSDCNDSSEHELSIKAVLDSSLVRKGCERSHDTSISVYGRCGAKDIVDLLPNSNHAWLEDLITEETTQGETNFIFDGDSATRLPRTLLGQNWQEKFTIAAWILVERSSEPQFIVSLSDGMKFGSTYVGLYVLNKDNGKQSRIGFFMNKDGGKCRFHEEWEVSLSDTKWRHVAVVVSKCNLQLQVNGNSVAPIGVAEHPFITYNTIPSQLQVNGNSIAPIGVAETLQPHQSHIQPKYVIGGRWLGTHQKYTDLFKGKISQMIFTRSVIKNFDCILKCQENMELLSPLPNGFQLETSSKRGKILITGTGSLSSLQKLIGGIVYYNNEPYPTSVGRKIHIEAKIDDTYYAVGLDVDIPKSDGPKILVSGKCDNVVKVYGALDKGLQVCQDVKVKVDGCLKFLDEATISIDSDVIGSGNLTVSKSVLKRFGLRSTFSANVLNIVGVARFADYNEVLANVFYTPVDGSKQKSMEVRMEVSAENGRFISNEVIIQVRIKSDQESSDKSSVFFLHSKSDLLPGSIVMDKNKSSKGNKNFMVISLVFSLGAVVAIAGFAVFRIARRYRESVEETEVDLRSTELLWDDEGLTAAVNITMNPLLRFRPDSNLSDSNLSNESVSSRGSFEEEISEASLYWSESEEENESDREIKNSLEWDSSYQEEFGEVFDDVGTKEEDCFGTDRGEADKIKGNSQLIVATSCDDIECNESTL